MILVVARAGLTDAWQRLLRLLLASHLAHAFSVVDAEIGLVASSSEEKVAIMAAITLNLSRVALL